MSGLPQHVAIIPDGGRRWAKRRGIDWAEGYLKGLEVLENTVKFAASKKIPFISFWVLSHENEKRTPDWLTTFFSLLKKYLQPKCEAMFAQNIAVKIIGDWQTLNVKKDIESILKNNPTDPIMTVVFFLCYSGTRDLEQAVAQLIEKKDTPENIKKYLQTRQAGVPDPELLIRTSDVGDVKRFSDFAMIQCAYTELYFPEKLWPDFTPEDFEGALTWFAGVERRFGK